MRYLLIALVLFVSGCAAPRVLVKDCHELGGEVKDCEKLRDL